MSEQEQGYPILDVIENAEEFFGMVPTSEDDRPEHHTRFGIARVMTRAEAEEKVKRSVDETSWLSLMNLATALHVLGESKSALTVAARAAQLYPNSHTLLNMSVILEAFGRFDESLELARKAIEMNNTNQFAGLLWAQGMLRQGRWAEAWPAFEWYCWGKIWEPFKQFIPQWEGEDLHGKTIFVLQGGGFGDNMMFFRWLGELKRTGARVVYACPDTMVPLLEGHEYCDELLPTHEGPETGMLPEVDVYVKKDEKQIYDYFIPIMALPRRFNATVETIPYNGPYIWPKRAESFGYRGNKKVGFCWKAGEVLDPRRQRSLTKAQAAKLLSVDNVDWVSLQYGLPLPTEKRDSIIEPVIKNWADTAAIVEDLDLVVTVDTGVMHLAGAMGKPCWVLLSSLSDWKFFMEGDSDPFYPSIRLFRNGKGVTGLDNSLNAVIEELKQL